MQFRGGPRRVRLFDGIVHFGKNSARLVSCRSAPVPMFRRSWLLHRDRIYSDEGFFVLPGEDWLVYFEHGRRMTITVEMGSHGFAVYSETIGRWDDNPVVRISDEEHERIQHNIKRALESQGQAVTFI
jgi:hypothetical protein